MFKWNKMSFLVSGGSRGLGRQVAISLAKKGSLVGIISRTVPYDIPEDVSSYIVHFQGSITDEDLIKEAFNWLLKRDRQFYGFVHCAANLALGEVNYFKTDDYSLIIDTQLKGAFLLTKIVYEYLKHNNEGIMIFIGSILSHESTIDSSLYVMAKHGLEGFAKAIRDDLFWSKIRVYMVCPDDLNTSFIPKGPPHPSRVIDVKELSSFIISLIPPKNTFYPFHLEIRGIPKE